MKTLKCKLCGKSDISNFRKRNIRGKIYYVKECRECERKRAVDYYRNHKDDRKEYQKKYIEENKEKVKEKKKEYDKLRYEKLRDEYIERAKQYRKNNSKSFNENRNKKRKEDIGYKLSHYVSSSIRGCIKKNGSSKKGSCTKYLPYSFFDLKEHLEGLFEDWMNWNNHGVYNSETWDDDDQSTWTWQIDHIVPHSDLPYTSMEDENFKKCWALENLRPYSAKFNVIDGVSRVRHGKK